MKYHVRYYDSKLSKKGKGTQVAAFKTRAEAEEFAGRNQIYSGPCRVELVAEPEDEAALLAVREMDEHVRDHGIAFMLKRASGLEVVHPSWVRLRAEGGFSFPTVPDGSGEFPRPFDDQPVLRWQPLTMPTIDCKPGTTHMEMTVQIDDTSVIDALSAVVVNGHRFVSERLIEEALP